MSGELVAPQEAHRRTRARNRPHRSDRSRRDDRSAVGGLARRSAAPTRRFPVDRHQRSDAIHARDGPLPGRISPRSPTACIRPCCASSRPTVQGADKHGKWVGVCGALAGDPVAVPLLVGLGVTELSVDPVSVPGIKARVRNLDYPAVPSARRGCPGARIGSGSKSSKPRNLAAGLIVRPASGLSRSPIFEPNSNDKTYIFGEPDGR